MRRRYGEYSELPPCHVCQKPDLLEENEESWVIYQQLVFQFRASGLGDFIATDFSAFDRMCDYMKIEDWERSVLWQKIGAIDDVRRKHTQNERRTLNQKQQSRMQQPVVNRPIAGSTFNPNDYQ